MKPDMRRYGWLLLLAAAGCSPEPDRDAAQSEVLAANARYDAAIVAGDAATLQAMLADDYVYVSPQGDVRDKATQLARLGGEQVGLREGGSKDLSVRWIDGNALVVGRFAGTYDVQDQAAGFEERYSALWSRQDGAWRLRHEHATLIPARDPLSR